MKYDTFGCKKIVIKMYKPPLNWNLLLVYTIIQKFGVCKIFLIFLKEVSYAHQGWI